ncbi:MULTISPECIES: hypothetical protein [unclassified Streptomyces]|uniref:hypothetical protein n=1 Tax=unclassified Streptomyces TaxID=2593676 RepID=UPI002DDB5B02|nr:hypothetical protein [Streptomyces sp. NBC_01750]WSA99306.1 hypothetical protein OIE54_08565 [Streptomyces sp. NBC_01794]WSD36126.1 hypothetical protein OG966_32005 [Streptomyces sp. NBC_01750]
MILVGITGHQDIPADAEPYLRREIENALSDYDEPVAALTSLAVGADQMFAQIALARGIPLRVVTPSHGYDGTFPQPQDLARYRQLKAQAVECVQLDHAQPSEEAFHAAGVYIADRVNLLLAVWDGEPARGFGGTADIVRYARGRGTPVLVIWKEGSVRG